MPSDVHRAGLTGALGGIRSLQHTRLYLSNLGFVVLPDQLGVPFANKVFAEDGAMTDERLRTALESAGAAVEKMASLLKTDQAAKAL